MVGATEMLRRTDAAPGTFAVMEGHITALERIGERGTPKCAGLTLHCREEQRDSASRRDRTQDGGAIPVADPADG